MVLEKSLFAVKVTGTELNIIFANRSDDHVRFNLFVSLCLYAIFYS